MKPNGPPPANPIGEFSPGEAYSEAAKSQLLEQLRDAPAELQRATSGLTDAQLDTKYKNWTVRQITHHLADSHLHSLIRFKWALTEDNPLIKAYEEADWVKLEDCRRGEIEPALSLLYGLHAKWVQLAESMAEDQFRRTFRHPQSGETVDLWTALNYYAWHGRHHTGQIDWLGEQYSWNQ